MARFHEELRAALRERILAVWPEVRANGVWNENEITTIPWERLAQEGRVPLVVLGLSLRSDAAWDPNSTTETGEAKVSYVQRDDEKIDLLESRLSALQEGLWEEDDADVWQVPTFPDQSTDIRLPLNAYFRGRQAPFYAGTVTLPLLVGLEPDE